MPTHKYVLRYIRVLILLTIVISPFAFNSANAEQNSADYNSAKLCLEDRIIEATNLIIQAKALGADPTSLSHLYFELNETVASLNESNTTHLGIGCAVVDNYPVQSEIVNSIVKTTDQLISDKDQKVASNSFALQVSPALGLVLVPACSVATALTFETVRRLRLKTGRDSGTGSATHSASKDSRRQAFTVLICSVMIYSLVFFITMNPRHEDQFYTLSVLDSNLKTGSYYPTADGIINVGETVSWSIEAESHKIPTSLLKLTVGIAGSPVSLVTYFPEPDVKTLAEYYHVASDEESWRVPLNWSVISTSRSGSVVNMCMNLNGVASNVAFPSEKDTQRLVIGLWAFDSNQQSYQLESWLQMWFDIPSYNSAGMQTVRCG
jgi:hypothetical protein